MEINPQVKTSRTMQRLRSSLYLAVSSFLLLPFASPAHAQDWVRTGSNLGVEKIRIAAADFKPNSSDPQTPVLKATFDNTLYNDLANAGFFDFLFAPFRPQPAYPQYAPQPDQSGDGADLSPALQRQVVFYRTTVVPGSIVVDRENRFLYLIDSNNSARRYGIGIAQECLKEGSLFRVANKLEWPDWRPSTVETAKDAGSLLERTGRPGSPLGSRALLLDKPGLIIHGTNSPKTIGHLVASGCIRLVNDDVEDLYRRVSLQSRVVFVS